MILASPEVELSYIGRRMFRDFNCGGIVPATQNIREKVTILKLCLLSPFLKSLMAHDGLVISHLLAPRSDSNNVVGLFVMPALFFTIVTRAPRITCHIVPCRKLLVDW